VPSVVLEEVDRVLREKFQVPPAVLSLARQVLESQTIVPRPATLLPVPVRGPDDAWVLASAVTGGADLLVTADAGLLSAAAASPIPPEDGHDPVGGVTSRARSRSWLGPPAGLVDQTAQGGGGAVRPVCQPRPVARQQGMPTGRGDLDQVLRGEPPPVRR
jgi:hypothetical protein